MKELLGDCIARTKWLCGISSHCKTLAYLPCFLSECIVADNKKDKEVQKANNYQPNFEQLKRFSTYATTWTILKM